MKFTTSIITFALLSCTQRAICQTIIAGKIDNLQRDTIKIVLETDDITSQYQTFLIPVKNGQFKQEFTVTKPTFLYISDATNYINGFIEHNDQVTINYDAKNTANTMGFTGKGSEKFQFLNSFYRFKFYNKLKEHIPVARQQSHPFDYMFDFIDSATFAFQQQLDAIKPSIAIESYNLLDALLKASAMGSKYRSVGMVYHENFEETLAKRQNELTAKSKKVLHNLLKFDNSLYYSTAYINEVYSLLFTYYDGLVLANKKGKSLTEKYGFIDSLLPPTLKTPVFTLFLENDISTLNQAEDIQAIIEKRYTTPEDSVYKAYVTNLFTNATTFKKGMDAPDFTVENEAGEKVTLASFKGKVVFLDFWYAACGPCRALFQNLASLKQHYASNDQVVFLCISTDPKDVWQKTLKTNTIEGYQAFTENLEQNHPIIKSYRIAMYPTTCLIDKNGKIFMANPSNNPQELQQQIEEALMVKGY